MKLSLNMTACFHQERRQYHFIQLVPISDSSCIFNLFDRTAVHATKYYCSTHSIHVRSIEIVSYDLGNQSLPLMNIYIGNCISVIETVVISFLFLPFTTKVKMQIKKKKGILLKKSV